MSDTMRRRGRFADRPLRAIPAIAALALAAVCGGCFGMLGFISVPTDEVRLEKVALVKTFEGVGGEVEVPFEKPWPDKYLKEHPGEGVLRISLSTGTDLAGIGADDEFHISIDHFICPFNVGTELIYAAPYESYGGTLIFVNRLAQTYRKNPELRAARPKGSRYSYEVYIVPRRPHRMPSGESHRPDLEPYDLIGNPQDICLRFRGGNMLGITLDSNVVVVPKKAIEEAVR